MKLLKKLDEPLADIGYISTGLIAEELHRDNIKVVLSGMVEMNYLEDEPFLKLKFFHIIKKFLAKTLLNFCLKF